MPLTAPIVWTHSTLWHLCKRHIICTREWCDSSYLSKALKSLKDALLLSCYCAVLRKEARWWRIIINHIPNVIGITPLHYYCTIFYTNAHPSKCSPCASKTSIMRRNVCLFYYRDGARHLTRGKTNNRVMRILMLYSFSFRLRIAKRGLKLPIGGYLNYVHIELSSSLSGIASSSIYVHVRFSLSVWNCSTTTSVDNMVMMRSNPRVMYLIQIDDAVGREEGLRVRVGLRVGLRVGRVVGLPVGSK